MIRSKILGQEQFSQAPIAPPTNTNSDLGHFSIGSNEPIFTIFEDVPIPPKHLWIRAKVLIEFCQDIPVIGISNSFVWSGNNRCSSIKLESIQVLHAQKDYEIDKCWQLSQAQTAFEHKFAVASTIYETEKGIHLWPCGGHIDNILEAEQLFAQVGSDAQMFVNSFSAWKKHLSDEDNAVFEPPRGCNISLLGSLTSGKFLTSVEQSGTQFFFSSCRAEATEDFNFIDILCERND